MSEGLPGELAGVPLSDRLKDPVLNDACASPSVECFMSASSVGFLVRAGAIGERAPSVASVRLSEDCPVRADENKYVC